MACNANLFSESGKVGSPINLNIGLVVVYRNHNCRNILRIPIIHHTEFNRRQLLCIKGFCHCAIVYIYEYVVG